MNKYKHITILHCTEILCCNCTTFTPLVTNTFGNCYILIYPSASTIERTHDGKIGKFKWSSLHVYQLDLLLEEFKVKNVLQPVYDRRRSKLDNLCKQQMVDECQKLGLDASGKKVNITRTKIAYYSTKNRYNSQFYGTKFLFDRFMDRSLCTQYIKNSLKQRIFHLCHFSVICYLD